jgi:hypothetical protein
MLLTVAGYLTSVRSSAEREAAALTKTRDRLKALADRIEAGRAQADREKRTVSNVFRLARSADEIPGLQGDRVVAAHQGHERLCLYVPAGPHALEISTVWKLQETASQPGETGQYVSAGEKAWSVPLLPACGYFFKFEADRKSGPVHWQLTSNHPEFQAQSQTVPVEGFVQRGSSWSGGDVVLFPNQIERFTLAELEAAAASHPGLPLMDAALNGVIDGRPGKVEVKVRLRSDAPACVSAADAQRVIVLGRGELLQPYQGGGKYDLRSPEGTNPAP